ncbi:MAG: apolipoprotein N-acyltransferase, partial [Nitrospirae bacterium]
VGLEYIRGAALTGFPWSLVGYSQTEILPIMQVADITGIYGVSFFVVLLNLTLYGMVYKRWPIKKALLLIVVLAIFLGYGLVRQSMLEDLKPHDYIKVAMVQPNIEQQLKWDPQYKRTNLEKLFHLTERLLPERPDLVVWPETALPFYFGYEKDLTERLQTFVRKHHLYLLTGTPLIKDIKKTNNRYQYITSNSAILLGPDGKVMASYDKIHLVPFGEYVPLRKILFFVNRLVEGIGDFKRGEGYTTFEINHKRFFVLICYEAIFPSLVRDFGEADFMVNITNDAWFGTSSGPFQHADIARVRAIEMRRPMVRVANSGISEVVDIFGSAVQKSK